MPLEQLKPLLYWSGLLLFLFLELRFSYRPSTVSKTRRWLANLPLTVLNGSLYHFLYFSTISGLLLQAETNRSGLLNHLQLAEPLKILAGIVILDFVIYVWHLLNHEVPLFWRFHRVHHSDMFLDVSTGSRFHLGELLLSGLLRLAVIYTFGIPVAAYLLFEILANGCLQFHHSSIRIPASFEKIWQLFFVPPSMHRIHHSVKIRERDSNYGVIFSLWDRFLGTLTTGTDQQKIVIGIGSHRDFEKLGFLHLLLMPFTRKSI